MILLKCSCGAFFKTDHMNASYEVEALKEWNESHYKICPMVESEDPAYTYIDKQVKP